MALGTGVFNNTWGTWGGWFLKGQLLPRLSNGFCGMKQQGMYILLSIDGSISCTLYKVTKISDKKIVEPYCKWQRMYTDHCLNPECNYIITWTNIWIITLLTDYWYYYLLNFQVDAPQSQVVGSVLTSQVGIFLKIIFTVMIFMQHSKMFYFFLVLIHKGLLKNHTKGEKIMKISSSVCYDVPWV